MILFLLPLLFNPFGMVLKWLPALYLALWPVIIQTLGRETLVAHALVLILFILTCDITRQIMHKFVGIDLISLPLGVAMLAACLTEPGMLFLSLITPVFGALLTAIEPVFLLIEIYLVMDMLRTFNKWLALQANVRDEEAHDLSTWDPPLARGALVARIFIILITILSYIGVYFVLQESKNWLGSKEDIPVNFDHAIAALVTLQLVALTTTIYKEEGVISESAMAALLASVPIFIASWSYHHMKETASSSHSTWTSYLPFGSLFGANSGGSSPTLEVDENGRLLGDGQLRVEQALEQLAGLGLDGSSRQLLSVLLRRLIIIINSILGSSRDSLAKYYFGKDFWYTLLVRLACLGWWALVWSAAADESSSVSAAQPTNSRRPKLNKHTLVKILLVLGYAQMLCQQLDNRSHLQEVGVAGEEPPSELGCCQEPERRAELAAWLECMWTSARACGQADEPQRPTRFARMGELASKAAQLRLLQLLQLLRSLGPVWLARWRSPIVQRLGQSILVQAYYIKTLLFW